MSYVRGQARRRRLLPNAVDAGIRKLILQAGGFLLCALAIAGWLSLMSWSVTDPSFNHATRGAPANWLGFFGAAVADLAFQSLGLAAVALFLAPFVWGWHLAARSWPGGVFLRVLLWPVAALFLAGALAALPAPKLWPLPNGFGGIMGDLLIASLRFVIGFLPAPIVSLLALIGLLSAGTMALLYASGIPVGVLQVIFRSQREESSGLLAILIGAPLHWLLSSRALLARLTGRSRPHEEDAPIDIVEGRHASVARESAVERETVIGEAMVDGRIEPFFGEAGGRRASIRDAREMTGDDPYDDIAGYQITRSHGTREARKTRARVIPFGPYELPPMKLLRRPTGSVRGGGISDAALQENARLLESVLDDFGVKGEIINVRPGPVVTLYELEPAPGTKSSRVIGLADDIARSMSAIACRVAVVPGRNVIGIELPNIKREIVLLRELMESEDFQSSDGTLALALGKNIGGEPVVVDLARMPHLLIAGTTGSGKSVGVNTMILSLLYRLDPEQCKFIMIDPKMLELSVYDGIPHLLAPVVTDPKKAIVALKWTVREMEERYRRMSKLGVRSIEGYNRRVLEAEEKGETLTRVVQTGFDKETGEAIYEQEEMEYDPMPYIVVIVDEMADLMIVAGKDIEGAVQRLAQMARAAGIHMITATQRPSVDVITGTIKANFPTRVSFQVTSKIDSRTILGEQGAEQLLGQGDMLYMAGGGRIMRVHGPFVSDEEVEKVVRHLKRQGTPEYLDDVTAEDDEEEDGEGPTYGDEDGDLYEQAVAIVLRDGKASTSYVQRRLGIGYNRAATIIERMEEEGLIGPANHAGKREILVGDRAAERPY